MTPHLQRRLADLVNLLTKRVECHVSQPRGPTGLPNLTAELVGGVMGLGVSRRMKRKPPEGGLVTWWAVCWACPSPPRMDRVPVLAIAIKACPHSALVMSICRIVW